MANQTRDAVIKELIKYLRSNIRAIKSFEDGPAPIGSIPDRKTPVLYVVESDEPLIDLSITSTIQTTISLELQLYYNDHQLNKGVGRNISDDLIKYIESASTDRLPDDDGNETCVNITAGNETSVYNVQEGGLHERIRSVEIILEQDRC